MRVNIKTILTLFLLLTRFSGECQTNIFFDEDSTVIEKKNFDEKEYERLKKEVDLIEEMEQKRLEADSSEFGLGYGVEKGKDYIFWEYDSIEGTTTIREQHRGSGARNANDGIQPDARRYERRKEFQRRDSYDRGENRRRQIEESRLEREKREKKSKPRQEKKYNEQSDASLNGSFFKFLLIIVIAGILGFAGYMLFANNPMQGESHKILYDQEMNPESVKLSELEKKILAAKESNDFRSATRLYFIWVIKELSDKGFIQWKKRKTNYHYQIEVQSQSFFTNFKEAVKNYEFIWYGKYEIDGSDFDAIEQHFKTLIADIKK